MEKVFGAMAGVDLHECDNDKFSVPFFSYVRASYAHWTRHISPLPKFTSLLGEMFDEQLEIFSRSNEIV